MCPDQLLCLVLIDNTTSSCCYSLSYITQILRNVPDLECLFVGLLEPDVDGKLPFSHCLYASM